MEKNVCAGTVAKLSYAKLEDVNKILISKILNLIRVRHFAVWLNSKIVIVF